MRRAIRLSLVLVSLILAGCARSEWYEYTHSRPTYGPSNDPSDLPDCFCYCYYGRHCESPDTDRSETWR
jgi:hypothetical protein